MKQHFLQLAHTFDPKKHEISGRYVSEKLDGLRFFWDGGISGGIPVEQVPWANIAKSNSVPIATGLWSRYAKVINAPDWWLDRLPDFPLDGELWSGRGQFQKISSIVRSTVNQKNWTGIKAMVFDSPPLRQVFKDREINETNFKKNIVGAIEWMLDGGDFGTPFLSTFERRLKFLQMYLEENEVVKLHEQRQLSFSTAEAKEELEEFLQQALDQGGEGLIIKTPNNLWEPERSHGMLKYKPSRSGEATVIGFTWGRETDKGSKLLGKMGALICEINAGQFKLSGFTDEEREMSVQETDYPGEIVSDSISNIRFPRGSKVTYKFRELTDAGLPKEGRYWRKA